MFQSGGMKTGEYYRTIEMLSDIFKEQGLYYVLAFIYDSGYTRMDIKNIMNLIKDKI